MGRPLGSIIQATIKYVCNSQVCLNVLHYEVQNVSSHDSAQDEQLAFLSRFNAVSDVIAKLKDCLSQEATIVEAWAQFIRPTRYAKSVLELDAIGGVVSDCHAQNLAATIVKRTEFGGDWAHGSLHLGGVPNNGYSGGLLEPAYKDLVEVLAAQLLEDVASPTGGGIYAPVLLHPPAAHGGSTLLSGSEVMDELRVMRRRTVGLGI